MLGKFKQIFAPGKADGVKSNESKRYNDSVVVLRQDNNDKKLVIEALNYNALKLLGYETLEIVNTDLRNYLPANILELVNENLEFSSAGHEVDYVLNRIPNFKLKTKSGMEVPLRVRAIRSLSSIDNHRFQLVMNDSSLIESLEAHRDNYRANMRGDEIFDKATGIISRESVIKDIELISYYTERNEKESCYAVFKFINFDDLRIENGDDGAQKMLNDIIKVVDASKREQDIIGLADTGAVILILPETPKENVKIPIARIMDKLPNEIKSELRVYYNSVKALVKAEDQLNSCMKGLAGTY